MEKKLHLILALFFLILLPLKSQFWKFVDFESNSDENALICLQFISEQEGWVAGTSGTIYYTNDGGQTWDDQSIPYETRIYTIEFVNSNVGYLSTDMGIFASPDGGISWELINEEIEGGFFKSLGFYDENVGWALDGHDVFKTHNGGETWQEIEVQSGSIVNYFVYPISADTCLISASAGYLYITYNGGESWEEERPILNTLATNIHFFDNSHGQFFAYGKVYWTYDCGMTYSDWKEVPIGQVSMISEYEGWVMNGINGVNNLHHTIDGWDTWEDQFIGNFVGLNQLHFENTELGWVVGDREAILKTIDGGNTWYPSKLEGPELNSVYSYDAGNNWLVGDNGLIYFKELENSQWVLIDSPVSSDLNSVHFIDDQNGWIAGDAGTLLQTTNGGVDWGIINLPVNAINLNSIHFENNIGVIVGDQGLLLISSDLGQSWEASNSMTSNDLLEARVLNNGDVISIGRSGTYLSSQDNGSTWNQINQFDDTSDLKSITFSSPENGFIVSENGVVYRSENGGVTWLESMLFENSQLNDILFTSEERGWIVGNAGNLLITENGGDTWSQYGFNVDLDLRSISFVSDGTGYIVGEKGTFLQYFPFTVSTGNIVNLDDVVLYPNPVHDNFSISINEGKLIESVQIYDLSGKSVVKIHNVNSNLLNIDVADLIEGIYIVSVTYDGIRKNSKVVIQ